MTPTLTSDLFEKLAPEFGVSAWVEPNWRTFGYLQRSDGSRRYWTGSALDLNTIGASELSRDKAYTNLVLSDAEITVPKGHAFGSKDWCEAIGGNEGFDAALQYAEKICYPVFVKPNSSQGGRFVYRALNRDDLSACLHRIFIEHKLALVEEAISGRDARILVLDGEVVLAYERLPLTVTGDGVHTIHELMVARSDDLVADKREVRILEEEERIVFTIRQAGPYTLRTVLQSGERLSLLPSANLATGGSTKDITKDLHPSIVELAVRATKLMNLRYAGVDIIKATEKSWSEATDLQTVVLEVNGKQPAVTHFGAHYKKEIEQLYRKLMRALLQ